MTNDNNNKLKLTGIITTFVLIFVGLVANWTTVQNTQKFTVSVIEDLKRDSSYPVKINEKVIISIKSNIKRLINEYKNYNKLS